MTINVTIWGASGHARSVIDAIDCSMGCWGLVGLIDNISDNLTAINGIVPWRTLDEMPKGSGLHLGVGNNHGRMVLAEACAAQNFGSEFEFITIIHPRAVVSKTAKIGVGTFIGANAYIGPNASVGNHVIVNTGAIIEHDCLIGDYSHVSPGAALGGNVQTGTCVWIGIGASVREKIQIGSYSLVGAGACVVKHVATETTVVGVPAKVLIRQ